MLKEAAARFDRTRCLTLVPDDSLTGIASESRAAEEIPDESAYVESGKQGA